MLLILLYFFIAIIIVQFIYYVVIFGTFSFGKKSFSEPKNIPISIIVCAKNDEANVSEFIPLLATQNYPNFEIVLIDDASSDETLEIFEAFEKKYPNINLVKVENNEAFWGNKKFALTLGIKASKNEYLLFTDADCYPKTENWLTEMSAHFNAQKTIVLGFGAYEKIKGSFLNKLIRFETILTTTQYFSWAKIGKPYTGVGRNLGYKKSEFYKTNGFINHMKIRSGDDELFINEAADSKNTAICYSLDSFIISKPKTTFSSWFTQKRRQVSTIKHYKFSDKLQLTLFYISQLLFLVLPVILLSFQFQWILVLSLIGFRYLFSWISLGYAASKLEEKDVVYWFPILEVVFVITQLNVFISNILSKPVQWR